MYSGRSSAKRTIGFFGDSFVTHPRKSNWMGKLADKYDAKIVNVGVSGSSYWNTMIHFKQNFHKFVNLDYIVFAWTDPFTSISNFNGIPFTSRGPGILKSGIILEKNCILF